MIVLQSLAKAWGSASALGCGSTRPRVEHFRSFATRRRESHARRVCSPSAILILACPPGKCRQMYVNVGKCSQKLKNTFFIPVLGLAIGSPRSLEFSTLFKAIQTYSRPPPGGRVCQPASFISAATPSQPYQAVPNLSKVLFKKSFFMSDLNSEPNLTSFPGALVVKI